MIAAATLPAVDRTNAARIWLRSVSIRDFRNLGRLDLALPAEGMAIIGDNGASAHPCHRPCGARHTAGGGELARAILDGIKAAGKTGRMNAGLVASVLRPLRAAVDTAAASEIIDLETKPDVSGKDEIDSAPMMPHSVVTGMVRNRPPRSARGPGCLPRSGAARTEQPWTPCITMADRLPTSFPSRSAFSEADT